MGISRRYGQFLWLVVLAVGTTGCGQFVARQLAQSPNLYPAWLAPTPRVLLAYENIFLTNFPRQTVSVGPPAARLRYRVIEAADYRLSVSSTNWLHDGTPNFEFSFRATIPGTTNIWTGSPRGTVVLLHGYGLADFALMPWALQLAQAGWRCVVPDLRGHGKSTGRQIYFGTQESRDLSQLLDELARWEELVRPVHVFGDSYGASLALRWKMEDPRIAGVVAMSPYASHSNAVLNIRREYAGWTPEWMIKAGLRELPNILDVPAEELDTTTLLERTPVKALFIAGEADAVVPLSELQELSARGARGSRLVVVPQVTHEALPYCFDQLLPSVLDWLAGESPPTR
jgi:pimeloyl-ACP methyl ester carboxylesterase